MTQVRPATRPATAKEALRMSSTTTDAGRPTDKLTIAEVCTDLGISRRTFYEWRAKQRAPRCIRLPNGDLRIRRSEYHRWLEAREDAA